MSRHSVQWSQESAWQPMTARTVVLFLGVGIVLTTSRQSDRTVGKPRATGNEYRTVADRPAFRVIAPPIRVRKGGKTVGGVQTVGLQIRESTTVR